VPVLVLPFYVFHDQARAALGVPVPDVRVGFQQRCGQFLRTPATTGRSNDYMT